MATIALLAPHHDPHGTPLRLIHWLDYLGGLVDEGYRTSYVIQDLDSAFLLPGHRHIFQKLENGVWDVFERAQINALVLPESLRAHITVILDDFTQDLRWEHFLL